MTNKLTAHLLPTEDASPIWFTQFGLDCFRDGTSMEKSDVIKPQHLYLVSDAPIKEGDWVLDFTGKISKTNKHTLETYIRAEAKKIEFTTDPKLIADGVPAIDGNTKVILEPKRKVNTPVRVNFLTEFCKRWNDKADMVIGCEMEEVKHQFSLNSAKHPTSHFQIKLDSNRQPTLIFN